MAVDRLVRPVGKPDRMSGTDDSCDRDFIHRAKTTCLRGLA